MHVPSPIDPAAVALFNRGVSLVQAGRPAEAVDLFVDCLRQAPHFGPGYVNLALVLQQFGLQAQALAMAEAAAALMPGSLPAMLCLASVRYAGADFAGAAALYASILADAPDHAGVLSSLANCLVAQGRAREALALHERAVALAPADVEARYNQADALLAAGALPAGWEAYEWRWQRPHARRRDFGPVWDGAALDGCTILLHAEQGFGDTLQFARYAPLVAARGGRVVLEVQPALHRLMQTLPGVAQVIAAGDTLPSFDAHCPLLSLPRAFATGLDSVPNATPYLHADPAAVAAWRQRLPADRALRVGLAWAGSAHPTATGVQTYDQRRSLSLADLAPLAGLAGVRLVSLQAGPPAEQLQAPPPGLLIWNGMAEVADFADTAALMAALDLVISVDTSVAHLAGALGRPVWLLSRSDGCWRWLQGRDDSPWYPTMRLYRQTTPLVWAEVIDRLRSDLLLLARRTDIAAA